MARKYLQPLMWTTALTSLYLLNPQEQFSLCPLKILAFPYCPGCGIGHALHYAMHFDFAASFEAHYLGIPALVIFCINIITTTFKIKRANT